MGSCVQRPRTAANQRCPSAAVATDAAEQQAPVADQLEAHCHYLAVYRCRDVCDNPTVAADVAAAAGSQTAESCRLLLAVQPGSPRSYLTAASLGMSGLARSAGRAPTHAQQVLQLLLPAFRIATAQRSQYWMIRSAGPALAVAMANAPAVAVSHADLAALVAAAEGVPAAMKQLSGVLPLAWVARLQIRVDQAAAALPAARARLQGTEQPVEATEWIQHARQAAIQGPAWLSARCACSGCGREALGLRRCSRCKKAACEWAGGCRALLGGTGWCRFGPRCTPSQPWPHNLASGHLTALAQTALVTARWRGVARLLGVVRPRCCAVLSLSTTQQCLPSHVLLPYVPVTTAGAPLAPA